MSEEYNPLATAPVTQKTDTLLFGLRNRMFGLTVKFFPNQTVIGGTDHDLTIVIPHDKKTGQHHAIYFYDFAESRQPLAWINHCGNEVTFVYSERDHVVKIHHTQEMLCEAMASLYNALYADKLGHLPPPR